MEQVISSYVAALDELNPLTATSYYTADGDETERAKKVADDLFSFLVNAYTLGILNASSMLDTELTVNLDEMEEAIFAVIDGKTFEDRVLDHVRNESPGRLVTLAESESHRVYNQAVDNGAKEYVSWGNSGVTKIWYTVGDERVRDTHDYLEGVSVPVGHNFFTYDGDSAAYPGGFQKAENNVNCRCIVVLRK